MKRAEQSGPKGKGSNPALGLATGNPIPAMVNGTVNESRTALGNGVGLTTKQAIPPAALSYSLTKGESNHDLEANE